MEVPVYTGYYNGWGRGSMAKIHQEILEDNRRLHEIIKCAIMHSEGTTHKVISYELGISSPTVTRYIQRAKDLGLLKYELFLPRDMEIAEKLEETYGLREAWVFPIGIEEEITDMLASLAAAYLDRLLNGRDDGVERIAIGPGSTTLAFVKALSDRKRTGVQAASTSAPSPVETYMASNIVIGIAAGKWECELYRFDPEIPKAEQLDYADVFVFGVGRIMDIKGVTSRALQTKAIGFTETAVKKELRKLVGQDGVGIINYQPFDENGVPITWDLKEYQKHLGLTVLRLDMIKEIAKDEAKRVVCVAGGSEKVEAIRAALEGRYFNVLITDHATAADLLEQQDG
jgi:deoxyribonucleoside regulator